MNRLASSGWLGGGAYAEDAQGGKGGRVGLPEGVKLTRVGSFVLVEVEVAEDLPAVYGADLELRGIVEEEGAGGKTC